MVSVVLLGRFVSVLSAASRMRLAVAMVAVKLASSVPQHRQGKRSAVQMVRTVVEAAELLRLKLVPLPRQRKATDQATQTNQSKYHSTSKFLRLRLTLLETDTQQATQTQAGSTGTAGGDNSSGKNDATVSSSMKFGILAVASIFTVIVLV
ncbi:hypothetical protein C8J56DRAFT_1166331 [Mycena floridula]|nr:hypothetical protein C8J56DRAFT_1166331 [Mycena floridula]